MPGQGEPSDDFVHALIEKYRTVSIITPDEPMCHLGTTCDEHQRVAAFNACAKAHPSVLMQKIKAVSAKAIVILT